MQVYLDLLENILREGEYVTHTRTKKEVYRIIGPQIEFWTDPFFPLVTTRQINFKNVITELDWFLSGQTNNISLVKKNNHIWDKWGLSIEDVYSCNGRDKYGNSLSIGDCGPIYGAQWIRWKTTDGRYINQIQELIRSLREDPYSRRHIVSAWNPEFLPDENISPQLNVIQGKQSLAPCHTLFQVFVQHAPLWARINDAGEDFYRELLHRSDVMMHFHKHLCHVLEKSKIRWIKDFFNKDYYWEIIPSLFKKRVFNPDVFKEVNDTLPDRRVLHSEVINHGHILDHLPEGMESFTPPKKDMIHLKMYARSQDVPLGTVFNVASYSLLIHLLAAHLNMLPGRYIHTMGDAHIYGEQAEKVKEQLERKPLERPRLRVFNENNNEYTSFLMKNKTIRLEGYNSHPPLTYRIAV